RPPFRGDSPLAVALKHVSQDPTPPTQLVPSMPASLEAVVLRALAKDPAARYASGSEMAGDLRRAAGSGLPDTEPRIAAADRAAGSTAILSPGTPTEPLAPERPRHRQRRQPRRRWALWVMVLTGTVILGLLAWALLSAGTQNE